ncbi:hypothetical protein [Parendozoicomonas sp. Alg238-R29]|uniref:hypothetical protein n=1 Tax=Parendozoicomonas sp. Alg238-R29 TaxID=2993446 RepID=UPI00248E3655|nr:hypothetical protein [Parendozoicomonas sp. Alg238-R29]
MDALEELIRLSEDKDGFQRYLGYHHTSLADPEIWDGASSPEIKVVEAASDLPDKQLSELLDEAHRIAHMASSGPHHALAVLFHDDTTFHSIGCQFDRSRWAFENHDERFAAAEAYYDFSEVYGMPSRCQTFEGVPGLTKAELVVRDGEFVRNLQTMLALSENFSIRVHDKVGVEKCIQMTLYLEDLPVSELAFQKGKLGSLKRWPVYRYVIFYHPESGRYDVVAGTKKERKCLSEAASHCLMRNGSPREVIHHGYDLASLLTKKTFDQGDGIYRVDVLALSVLNHGDNTEYRLKPSKEESCLYTSMEKKGLHSPLAGDVEVLEVKLKVYFSKAGPGQRNKKLTFRITAESAYLSHKLDEPEARLLLYKYLRLWKLERSVPQIPHGNLL